MTDNLDIIVKTDSTTSVLYGRNGMAKLAGIQVWQGGSKMIHLDGISSRGNVINGGFEIKAEEMDELTKKWLEARGKEQRKVYICVSGGVVEDVYGQLGLQVTVIDDDNAEVDEDTEAENKKLKAEIENMKAEGVIVALDLN